MKHNQPPFTTTKEGTDIYGGFFRTHDHALIERECIRRGGSWVVDGKTIGRGLEYHYMRLISLLWPMHYVWHKWNTLVIPEITKNRIVGILGPASSGKTNSSAVWVLADYYCFPSNTTVLCSSTTREMLNLRVWGEIKKFHRLAKERHKWIPGHLIDSRQMLTTDGKEVEGRDFRNGVVGVACKIGGTEVGLANYIGVKNERVRLLADESQLMSKGFYNAISNLAKNPDFKLIALGNPNTPQDALGIICEPAEELGGWDGGIDQEGGTKTWKTRLPGGVCVQLVGMDSPNFEEPRNRYPFLIKPEDIERDLQYYGENSPQFLSMNCGRMPKHGKANRVISRLVCQQHLATDDPVWQDHSRITKLMSLDAAYASVGGDRNIAIEFWFGPSTSGKSILSVIGVPIVVPVTNDPGRTPEDQIAEWVKRECERRGIPPSNFFYDGTGRSSLTSALSRIWSPAVNPIEFGGRASERIIVLKGQMKASDRYGKFVTELWFNSRSVIEAGQMRGMTSSIIEEGEMREWMMLPNQKVDVEPKDITRKRLGRSPDIYDSFVCGIEGAIRLGFRVDSPTMRLGPTSFHRRNPLKEKADRLKALNRSKELSFSA